MSGAVSASTVVQPATGGQKPVPASSHTLGAVVSDLECNYSGIFERLIDNGTLHCLVGIYVSMMWTCGFSEV